MIWKNRIKGKREPISRRSVYLLLGTKNKNLGFSFQTVSTLKVELHRKVSRSSSRIRILLSYNKRAALLVMQQL